MPGTRCLGRASGHGRSEDRVSQQRLLRSSQGDSLVPRGDHVYPEGWTAGGWCRPGRRVTDVRTVSARRSVHGGSQWATARPVALSWKRAELGPGGLAREHRPGGLARAGQPKSSREPWLGNYVSDHRSGGAGGARPLQLAGYLFRRYPGLKRLQVGQPESAVVRVGGPEGLAALLQRSHEGTTIRCAFSTLPEEHPIGFLRWPLAHLAALHPSRNSGSRPNKVERLAPPKRPGLPVPPERQPARGRVAREAGQVRPPTGPG
jgi:hypothetical protein